MIDNIEKTFVRRSDCGCTIEFTAESAPVRAWVCEHGNEWLSADVLR